MKRTSPTRPVQRMPEYPDFKSVSRAVSAVDHAVRAGSIAPDDSLRIHAKLDELRALSALVSRSSLSQNMGQTYGGDRKLYEACGYPYTLDYPAYEAKYRRGGICKTVVNAFPDATWRNPPDVYETEDPNETAFEKSWNELLDKRNVWGALRRVDRLAGIGEYAILLIGFNDGGALDTPVMKATEVLYLQPYSQGSATIASTVSDPKDARYGLPEFYTVETIAGTTSEQKQSQRVHWSRVIHVADDILESTVFGTPRLEAPYNYLVSLETVVGGASEMFWAGGFPGFALLADADAELSPQSVSALEEEIEKYIHNLRRYMKLQGMQVQELRPQAVSPKDNVEILIQLTAATSRIPQRILTGSERGELASSQDETNWMSRVDERRHIFGEPVLRDFIDRLIQVGVLQPPADDSYIVDWPEINEPTRKEQVDVGKVITDAMAVYVEKQVEQMMDRKHYLVDVLGFSDEQAQAYIDEADSVLDEEDEEDPEKKMPPDPDDSANLEPGAQE